MNECFLDGEREWLVIAYNRSSTYWATTTVVAFKCDGKGARAARALSGLPKIGSYFVT
ncbi:MAG: hypothetical protein QM765_10950 [Myxococcales bacterium]